MFTINDILNKFSLTISMLLLMALIGGVTWFVTDYYQTLELRAVLESKLESDLTAKAREQRIKFYHHINSYNPGVGMYASNINLIKYVNRKGWQERSSIDLVLHKGVPQWLPKLSVMRSYVLPHYAMLFDASNQLRELYHYQYPMPPHELLTISEHELELSLDQSHITILDGQLFLVAASKVGSSENNGVLLLATPIDAELLEQANGVTKNNSISALLKDGESKILVSSNNDLVPIGTEISLFEKKYIMTGEDHFGTGSSDFMIKFVSLIPTNEVKTQTEIILYEDRKTRALNALFFFVAFGLMMFWITARIQKLTSKVIAFSSSRNIQQLGNHHGDQIKELESRFESLASEIEKETAELEYAALHDPLTGLPNRALFNDRLQHELLHGERLHQKFVLLMCDLNKFKVINDTLGHHIGDIVLRQVGEKLVRVLRKSDTVSRLGGDEYGLLLSDTSIDKSTQTINKILDEFTAPFVVDGNKLDVGISIGIVEFPQHGINNDMLLQRADSAMYVAKKNHSGYEIYAASHNVKLVPNSA